MTRLIACIARHPQTRLRVLKPASLRICRIRCTWRQTNTRTAFRAIGKLRKDARDEIDRLVRFLPTTIWSSNRTLTTRRVAMPSLP
jgi:hypothetical protein